MLPANTFAPGPTSGQFAGAGAGGNPLPLANLQPVQGFSAMLQGPTPDSYLVMTDNGFGAIGNSADALLRIYAAVPDWHTATGGSGTVRAANIGTGAALSGFGPGSTVTLSDPNRLLGYAIQADYTNYYDNAANPLVDPAPEPANYALMLGGLAVLSLGVRRRRASKAASGQAYARCPGGLA